MNAKYSNLNIERHEHDTIFVHSDTSNLTVVFDPFQTNSKVKFSKKADIIFISHDHFDHFSPKDILSVSDKNTVYVFPASILDKIHTFLEVPEENLIPVVSLEEYDIKTTHGMVKCMAVPAYNVNKRSPQGNLYHPKEKGYVGYLITIDEVSLYFAGDTDVIPEMNALKGVAEVLLLPISGVYVMDIEEALLAVDILSPAMVVPMHYGALVGSAKMALEFKEKLNESAPQVIIHTL